MIGFNRCGTTAFDRLFRGAGLASLHWKDDAGKEVAVTMAENRAAGLPILRGLERYQAFSDLFFQSRDKSIDANLWFRDLHHAAPDALFILNTRPVEHWIASRKLHGVDRGEAGYLVRALAASGQSEPALLHAWRQTWAEHHRAVRAHFDGNPRFVEFDIETGNPDIVIAFLRCHGVAARAEDWAQVNRGPAGAATDGVRGRMCAMALRLAAPFLDHPDAPLTGRMPAEQPPGARREQARIAVVSGAVRLLNGLAPMLEAEATGNLTGPPMLAAARRLLHRITDPASADASGWTAGPQTLVEGAFLAQAILRAPTALWHGLDEAVRDNIEHPLRRALLQPIDQSNWVLFPAMIEALFFRMGMAADGAHVDLGLRQMMLWYRGDGAYSDGPHLRIDGYNSFVIHPMLIDILDAAGDHDPDWSAMRAPVMVRARRWAEVLERQIAADGSFAPQGRSVTYRAGAFHLLAQLAMQHRLPATLLPAQVRGALGAVIARTLDAPGSFDPHGWLRIGLCGAQADLGETYIHSGSLYLTTAALLPLGLPASDPFWADPDRPWTQARLWSLGEDIRRDRALKDP